MLRPQTDQAQKEIEKSSWRRPCPFVYPHEIDVHPGIVAERQRRDYFRVKYQKELVQKTKTWEGFEAHLLFLRGTLEEHATTHMMQRWRMPPQKWPEVEGKDLWCNIGPQPERPYEEDRKWVIERFLQLQRWGHGTGNRHRGKWHEFRGQLWLLDLQPEGEPFIQHILDMKEAWLHEAREAWDALAVGDEADTETHRGEAILLLNQAFWAETYPEMQYGPRRWRHVRKERQQHYQRLAKLHDKAEKAVRSAIATLEEYRTAVWETMNKPDPPLGNSATSYLYHQYPPGMADKEGMAIEQRVAGLYTAVSEIQKQIVEAQGPLKLCFSTTLFEQSSPRGRREKSILNHAIAELGQKYSSLCSGRQTIAHIHALLYVAGMWPDDDAESFTAKFYQLRKRRAVEPPSK